MRENLKGLMQYGLRKSYVTKTARAQANYKASIEILKRSGRAPRKMDEVAALWK